MKFKFQGQDKDTVINIIDNDGNLLVRILNDDDEISLTRKIKYFEKNIENLNVYLKKELNSCKPYTEIIENNKKTIKLL